MSIPGLDAGLRLKQECDGVAVSAADLLSPSFRPLACVSRFLGQNGVSVGKLAGTIHPYPTTAECIRQAAAQYNKHYRTPAANKALEIIMAEQS